MTVFIAWIGLPAYEVAVRLARILRGSGVCTEMPLYAMRLKKALGLARRMDAQYTIIIGETEVAAGHFAVKRMIDAKQYALGEVELLELLNVKVARPEGD